MKPILKWSFVLLMASFALNGCEKGDAGPGCLIGNYGVITVTNSSSDNYNFYVDDALVSMMTPNSVSAKLHIKTGNNHKISSRMVVAGVVSPMEKAQNMNIEECKDYNFQIP